MAPWSLLLLAALAAPPPRVSAPRHRTKVAVNELETGLRADPNVSHLLTGLLAAELGRRPRLQVTSQEDFKSLLGMRKQQTLLGCTDASCLAEIGGALGVEQMVAGSLSRLGDSLVLLVRLVDVRRGVVLRDVTRRFAGATDDALLDAIPGVAAELYPNALPGVAGEAVASESAPSPRSDAPWWLVGSGAGVAAAGGILTAYEFASKNSQDTPGQMQNVNNLAYAGEAALGVGLAVLVGGVLWVLLRPAAPREATP